MGTDCKKYILQSSTVKTVQLKIKKQIPSSFFSLHLSSFGDSVPMIASDFCRKCMNVQVFLRKWSCVYMNVDRGSDHKDIVTLVIAYEITFTLSICLFCKLTHSHRYNLP